MTVPVLYRRQGERKWREGQTENISKTGILVRGDRVMAANAAVELVLDIPAHVASPFAGMTICRGRIARAVARSTPAGHPAFAAAIFEYETTHLTDPTRL